MSTTPEVGTSEEEGPLEIPPHPSEISRIEEGDEEIPGEGEEHDEEEVNDEEEGDGKPKSAPKVFRHYKIEYDREIDGPRKKKDLFWNIMALTYRQEYSKSVEARKAETTMKPGIRILGGVPKKAWTHYCRDPNNKNSCVLLAYGLNLAKLDVQDVSVIGTIPHIQYLDLSSNRMKIDSLKVLESLTRLKSLKVNNNRLSDVDVPAPTLEELHMEHNRLMKIEPFNLPCLETVNLSHNRLKNKIEHFNEESTPKLKTFICTHCRLKTTLSDWAPTLTNLYLGYNKIRKIEGLDTLVNLRRLHLRKNRIKKLKGFSEKMKNLEYINVRENKIANVKQFRKLFILPRLKILVCKENPFETERSPELCRLAIIYCMKKLIRINKDEVTIDEIIESLTAENLIDNEEDSSDDDIQEDLEDYDDEYNDAPPPEWELEDDEFRRYENAPDFAPVPVST